MNIIQIGRKHVVFDGSKHSVICGWLTNKITGKPIGKVSRAYTGELCPLCGCAKEVGNSCPRGCVPAVA